MAQVSTQEDPQAGAGEGQKEELLGLLNAMAGLLLVHSQAGSPGRISPSVARGRSAGEGISRAAWILKTPAGYQSREQEASLKVTISLAIMECFIQAV